MPTLVLATHNAHKVEELRRILGPALGPIELIGYDGPEPVEDGGSFVENALIKARAAAAHTGLPAIADDSGLCVDALGGEPGVDSAYYAGLPRSDAKNLALLIERMHGVAERGAEFVCAAALVIPVVAVDGPRADGGSGMDGSFEHVELGLWPGAILPEAAGERGFGYDPIFQPDGWPVSAAALTVEQKDADSHRSRAFRALLPLVRERLG